MILSEFPWQIFMSPFGIPIAGVICVFSWLAIASVAEAVTKVICNRNNADLKLELLARGFSADEIVRVVEAGGDGTADKQQRPWHTARHATAP